jgi:methionyl-tRNA formyltransferase
VKVFALEYGLKVFQPEKIRTPEILETFATVEADLAVVVAYGRILPSGILDLFPLGEVNVHFSLLPKYRGAAPVNWAIAEGERETGVTTMLMDAGLDTGAILLAEKTPIGAEENSIQLTERLSIIGAGILSRTLTELDAIEPTPQPEELASLAPILSRADGLIDWSMSSIRINDRVRGFQPFPSTFSYLGDKKITIWKSRAGDEIGADPGSVIHASGDKLMVAAGGGTSLAIEELQVEGKRRVPTRDFLNGIKVKEGDIFGKQG